MRHIFAILFISLSLGSLAQLGSKDKPIYLDADTLKGADTVYISLPELTGFYSLSFEIAFEQIGGTSDGTGILESANDTTYHTLNNSYGAIVGRPNDTIAISNGASYQFWVFGTASNKFRFKLIGTENDTTKVLSNYIRK